MKFLKGILEEELERCKRLEKSYDRELAKLPKGSLVLKKINKGQYYYLIYRDKSGKVCSDYKGLVSQAELNKYKEAKEFRSKYRHLRSEVKKEIKLLERMLHARELRAVS